MLAALAGGVGAARFLDGLLRVVPPSDVVVVVNTADDDEFHGLHVSPDLDSVTYTLAGASNTAQGWGLEGETFATLDALARFGVPTWFRLGDKDLATHVYRTQRLRAGMPLSAVTAEISAAWGLDVRLLPMSDDRVRTRITVAREHGTEELAMQEWFVGERAESPVVAVRFEGADAARPAPGGGSGCGRRPVRQLQGPAGRRQPAVDAHLARHLRPGRHGRSLRSRRGVTS